MGENDTSYSNGSGLLQIHQLDHVIDVSLTCALAEVTDK
jgi:hypothetical protein